MTVDGRVQPPGDEDPDEGQLDDTGTGRVVGDADGHDVTRVAGSDEPSDPARRSRPLLVTALVVALLVLLVVGTLGWQLVAHRAEVADRQQRAEVTAAFTEALLAYDHRDLDAALDRVAAVSTGSFAAEHRQRFDAGLADAIVDAEAVATADVTTVLLQVDPEGATATAVERTRATATAEVTVATADGSTTSTSTLQLALVRTADGWRVDDAAGAVAPGLDADGT